MRNWKLALAFVMVISAAGFGCGKDDNGSPTGPSRTTPGTGNPGSGATNAPNLALTRLIGDYTRTTPDPAAPWRTSCPEAFRAIASGQMRNAVVPQLAPNDTLSGGTVGVLSCGWTVVTGYANGQPRYPESDSTVLSNVPAKDGDVVHFWKGESFQKMRFELELPDSKAAINPSSLRASQEGGHWWIKGPLSSLTPSFTSMSFAQDTQEAASLITPMFSANSGRPTTVVYYEGEALDPYTVLYISPQGAMYRFDVRSPERGYARIR